MVMAFLIARIKNLLHQQFASQWMQTALANAHALIQVAMPV
jgi:hypothetical protein